MYVQISPAVFRSNIPRNPASVRVSLGLSHWLGDSPGYSQTSHNRSHGAPLPVIRDPSYSDGRPECPPTVWFSPEIDASKCTLRHLSDTPRGSQGLKYILLMSQCNDFSWMRHCAGQLQQGLQICPHYHLSLMMQCMQMIRVMICWDWAGPKSKPQSP